MKKLSCGLLVLYQMLFKLDMLHAQWSQTNGPYGGNIQSLAASGTNLFAGTGGGGVFLSTNNGTSWTAVNTGLTVPDVRALVVNGTNLFAGTNGGGVFLSTNNGTSWTEVNNGLTNRVVRAFAVTGTKLFAATSGGGVFLSTNNGASWNVVNSGLTNMYVQSLAIIDTNLFAGTGDFHGGISGSGVFLSTNNGTSWTAVGLTDTSVSAFAVIGTKLFAGTDGRGVLLSTNNGTSWTPANSGPNTVLAFAVKDTSLFAGTYLAGVFFSANNGTSWTIVNTGLTNGYVQSFALKDSNIFAGTFAGGVFLSSNSGASWTGVNAGLTNGYVRAIDVNGTNLFAGTNGGGVFLSTNNGTNWTEVNNGLTDPFVSALARRGSNFFVGALFGLSPGVFLTTNNGTSWTAVNSGLTNPSVNALAAGDTNVFVGTNGGGVFRSTNNGTTWAPINNGLTNLIVRALAVSGTNVFAGTGGGGVFLSTNNGTSWTAVNTGLTDFYALAFAVNGSNLFVAIGGSGVFLSTNNGASWSAVNTGLTNPYVSAFSVSGANLFAGTTSGIFLSTNNGTSWSAVNGGLSNSPISALAANATNVFAGTNGGVWSAILESLVPPSSPQSLVVKDSLNGSISLKWRKNTETDFLRYRIYKGVLPNPITKLDSTTGGITDTSKSFSGLTYGVRYFFRVTAVDSSGNESDYSNEVNSALYDVTEPAAPQNLAVYDSSSHTVTIKWKKNTEADFLRYRIYRSTSPAAATKVDSTSASASDTSKTFSGLANSTRYYLRVTAVDSGGNESAYSNEVNAAPADRVAPAGPTNLVVTDSSSTKVSIKWRKNTESDFLRYRIYRGTATNPTTKVDSTTGGITDTSKTFTGLTNGTRYYLRATAVDSAGNESGYSNEVSATPADRIPPAPPTNLVVTDTSSTKIGIKWRKSTEPDFMRYLIYRGTSSNPTTKVDSTTGGVTDTSKTFTALTNGTRYYLRLTAIDSSGNESLYSNEVSGIPNAALAVEDLLNLVPKEYSLSQNYPNPFNPSTVIRYGLPERSYVKVQIYDFLGRVLQTLVSEEQDARFYEISWFANAATGIYFYRITAVATSDPAKTFTQTKRMTLLK